MHGKKRDGLKYLSHRTGPIIGCYAYTILACSLFIFINLLRFVKLSKFLLFIFIRNRNINNNNRPNNNNNSTNIYDNNNDDDIKLKVIYLMYEF